MALGTIKYKNRNRNEGNKFAGHNQTPDDLQSAVLIAGFDGSKTQWLKTTSEGKLQVDGISVENLNIEELNVSAFQDEEENEAKAKVNDNKILVVQTGDGADSSEMNKEVATEETLSKLLGNFLLDKKDHNSIELEYIADGNGKGEIGEVKYYKETDLLYTLTLTYDSENRLTKVERVDENEN